jgi:hypothetical protein
LVAPERVEYSGNSAVLSPDRVECSRYSVAIQFDTRISTETQWLSVSSDPE